MPKIINPVEIESYLGTNPNDIGFILIMYG